MRRAGEAKVTRSLIHDSTPLERGIAVIVLTAAGIYLFGTWLFLAVLLVIGLVWMLWGALEVSRTERVRHVEPEERVAAPRRVTYDPDWD